MLLVYARRPPRDRTHVLPNTILPRLPMESRTGILVVPAYGRTPNFNKPTTIVYTDASLRRGRGGIGFTAKTVRDPCDPYHPYPSTKDFSTRVFAKARFPDINGLELTAILAALVAFRTACNLIIYTDSQTALDNILVRPNKRYTRLAHYVLAMVIARRGATVFGKVKGHAGNAGNVLADDLAAMGTMSHTVFDPIVGAQDFDPASSLVVEDTLGDCVPVEDACGIPQSDPWYGEARHEV